MTHVDVLLVEQEGDDLQDIRALETDRPQNFLLDCLVISLLNIFSCAATLYTHQSVFFFLYVLLTDKLTY